MGRSEVWWEGWRCVGGIEVCGGKGKECGGRGGGEIGRGGVCGGQVSRTGSIDR